MAIHYVDSNASGANNGTSWTDAWVNISSAVSVAAGDTVYFASDHVEDVNSSVYNFTNSSEAAPIKLISVNSGTGNYEAGAEIKNTTAYEEVEMAGALIIYGMTFSADLGVRMPYSNGVSKSKAVHCYECTFKLLRTSGANGTLYSVSQGATYEGGPHNTFRNCTLDWSPCASPTLAAVIGQSTGGGSTWIDTTFNAGTVVANEFISGGYNSTYPFVQTVNIDGADISGITTAPIGDRNLYLTLRRVKLPTSHVVYTFADGEPGFVLMEYCSEGSLSKPSFGLTHYRDYKGDIKSVTTHYKTEGASDGYSAYSWDMTTTANTAELYQSLKSIPISRWVEAGSQNITIRLCTENVSLNDDDFWIEVTSNATTAMGSSEGVFNSTRMGVLGTPAALTSDTTSEWNGFTTPLEYEITVAINPGFAGPVTVRCFLARPSTTVYVDPKIEVTA